MTEQIKQKLKDILIEHKNIAASEVFPEPSTYYSFKKKNGQ